MKQNFEQDKSVSYSLLASRFVIPWGIEDSKRIHAEVETSDGVCAELIPEEDFVVDCEDNFLTLKNTDVEGILRIYDGEKQELKYSIDPNIRSPHNLVRDGDLSPMYLRLDNLEKLKAEVVKKEEHERLKAEVATKAEIERLKAEVATKAEIERLKRLEAESVKKGDFDRLEAKAVEKKDLKNLVTTDAMKAYLEDHTANVDAENKALRAKIDKLEARIANNEKHVSTGDLILQATESNKTPCIYFRGQDGKNIAQMFIRDGVLLFGMLDENNTLCPWIKMERPYSIKFNNKTIENSIRGEKDPRYGELISDAAVTKVGDIYNGIQILNWIYGEGITPPLTPEERLKKWRVVRDHAGTGKHCRGAFIEHND